ncbi:MAG: 2-C-methyl-D-erythritol 2,4-cyclodiphosphate synthase, partial [Candidatus Margulisbacteria bacterium]|nr:2-C-methyl-D-erythritol 2,4-cyclodiphosphate synthase [Candidatus Margulisiibacteriota bacterium]
MRVGIGYDVHQLTAGRKLIIGGVDIPYARGLDGHSDADVLLHAVMDALLGAAALGSIGEHFPDTDPAYQGINSLELLENVNALLISRGYKLINLDSVIICQEPKLAPYIQDMQTNIAVVFGLPA